MSIRLTPPEIERAVRDRDFVRLRATLAGLESRSVAEAIERLEPEDRAVVFRVLQRDQAAETFEYLSPDSQQGLIRALGQGQVADILNAMSPDDRTQLLEELPAAVTKQLLELLSPEERAVANNLLGYPEESIGRLMTPDVISIRGDWTVERALDHIRRNGQDSETLNVINVVDDQGKLTDALRVRQLLLTDPVNAVSSITDGKFVALRATDDQETAVAVFKEHDRVAIPVVDSSGSLLGIVTVDDVLDVAEEEATEDIQKLGASEALEQPYMQVSLGSMMRKRMGWLIVLFLGQLLTLNAMEYFSQQIARAIFLVAFVPLIISSGGNSGSQAATLVIRAMALGEVELRDWWRVMRRELLFGLALGSILAVIGLARIAFGEMIATNYGDLWGPVALAVGISLLCVVLWGVLVGSMLPFVMRAVGVDPATSSTPFVATVVDVTGLIIYFSLATYLLP